MKKWSSQWPHDYRCDTLPTELWSHWRWEQVNIIVGSCVPVKEMSVNVFQASLRNCINCVHCDNHFFIFISFPPFKYDLFHISLTKITKSKYPSMSSFNSYELRLSIQSNFFVLLSWVRTGFDFWFSAIDILKRPNQSCNFIWKARGLHMFSTAEYKLYQADICLLKKKIQQRTNNHAFHKYKKSKTDFLVR